MQKGGIDYGKHMMVKSKIKRKPLSWNWLFFCDAAGRKSSLFLNFISSVLEQETLVIHQVKYFKHISIKAHGTYKLWIQQYPLLFLKDPDDDAHHHHHFCPLVLFTASLNACSSFSLLHVDVMLTLWYGLSLSFHSRLAFIRNNE